MAVNMMLARQGSLFEEDGRAKWSGDVGVAAMNAQLDMVRVHKVTPDSAISLNSEELFEHFAAGRYAVISASSVRIPVLQKAIDPLLIEDNVNSKPGEHYVRSIIYGRDVVAKRLFDLPERALDGEDVGMEVALSRILSGMEGTDE